MADLSLLAACAETLTERMEPFFKIQGDFLNYEDFYCTEVRTTALMYFDGLSEIEVCRAESSTTLSSEFGEVGETSCCPEAYD